jgi:hypothetical protein
MTSAEEVLRIPSSIGARQAEPPAPEEELVHVFFASTCTFDWPYFGPLAHRGAHMEGSLYDVLGIRRLIILSGANVADLRV